jgi:hypothetical protein
MPRVLAFAAAAALALAAQAEEPEPAHEQDPAPRTLEAQPPAPEGQSLHVAPQTPLDIEAVNSLGAKGGAASPDDPEVGFHESQGATEPTPDFAPEFVVEPQDAASAANRGHGGARLSGFVAAVGLLLLAATSVSFAVRRV